MSRPVWLVEAIKRGFPGRFMLARMTQFKPIESLINRWLFEGDDLSYLPANLSVHVGESPIPATEYLLPTQIIEHFIAEASVLWVMNECICRSATGCSDFSIDLGCLFMGTAAAGINPRLGKPVTKQEAREHIQRASSEGLVHLIGRNKLDTVWLGVGPGSRLLTVCNCCPCCCLWRMHPDLHPEIRATLHRIPGLSLAVTGDCTGCELCLDEVCFVNAIEFISGSAMISERCLGCGRCASVCPEGAIIFEMTGNDLFEGMVHRISDLVDVT